MSSIHFQYGKRVKVSNWCDRALGEPKDIEHPKHIVESHYRTFGLTDVVYMPKTTTQDCLESILNKNFKTRSDEKRKPQVNFKSYSVHDGRFNSFDVRGDYPDGQVLSTTYRDVFKPFYEIKANKDCCSQPLDPLINRIPKNDFEMLPASSNKFMDDHLTMLSEGRKKINTFRQIRNSTYFLSNPRPLCLKK